MQINMLSNIGSKRLLSFQAILSEPEVIPNRTSNQILVKPGVVNGKN
jgi:hypothetical protein